MGAALLHGRDVHAGVGGGGRLSHHDHVAPVGRQLGVEKSCNIRAVEMRLTIMNFLVNDVIKTLPLPV